MQDKEKGGISDRPNDAVDVFHTYFGVAGMFSFSLRQNQFLVCNSWISCPPIFSLFPGLILVWGRKLIVLFMWAFYYLLM